MIWIGDWRVNGNIAVSRSIGDKDHKPYVSADPDTLEFDLEGRLLDSSLVNIAQGLVACNPFSSNGR